MSSEGLADERAVSGGEGDAECLDARGLLCPLPVIRTQDRVRTLAPGALLDVLATDPGVLHDIPAWCRVHGHRVVFSAREGEEIRIRVEVCET